MEKWIIEEDGKRYVSTCCKTTYKMKKGKPFCDKCGLICFRLEYVKEIIESSE